MVRQETLKDKTMKAEWFKMLYNITDGFGRILTRIEVPVLIDDIDRRKNPEKNYDEVRQIYKKAQEKPYPVYIDEVLDENRIWYIGDLWPSKLPKK